MIDARKYSPKTTDHSHKMKVDHPTVGRNRLARSLVHEEHEPCWQSSTRAPACDHLRHVRIRRPLAGCRLLSDTMKALAEAIPDGAHVRCPYCFTLFPLAWPAELGLRHDEHPHGCASLLPDSDEIPARCYSCGHTPPGVIISGAQRNKYGGAARCQACVSGGNVERWVPPQPVHPQEGPQEELFEAVSNFDVRRVQELLRSGADPNCPRQAVARNDRVRLVSGTCSARWVKLFTRDGTPLPDEEPGQPTTPLKLVVFRISDCMLGVAELAAFKLVAELLLAAGADPIPAVEYARERYGDWTVEHELNSLEDEHTGLGHAFRDVLDAVASYR